MCHASSYWKHESILSTRQNTLLQQEFRGHKHSCLQTSMLKNLNRRRHRHSYLVCQLLIKIRTIYETYDTDRRPLSFGIEFFEKTVFYLSIHTKFWIRSLVLTWKIKCRHHHLQDSEIKNRYFDLIFQNTLYFEQKFEFRSSRVTHLSNFDMNKKYEP